MTTRTIHLIGGPGHGTTLAIKGGKSVLMYKEGRQFEYRHQEMIVNGCSFLVGLHNPTPAQMSEVQATLYRLMRDVRSPADGRVMHTHLGLHDEWDSERAATMQSSRFAWLNQPERGGTAANVNRDNTKGHPNEC